ncbi:MAG: hydrogenase maturation protease [Ignavibacteria bacterium]
MNYPLIIGIGNEFRGDDAIGIIIARKLKEDFPTFEIIESSNELELIEYFKNYDRIVLIDAINSEQDENGSIKKITVDKDFEFSKLNFFSSHSISLSEILQIAKIIGHLPPTLIILGINCSNFKLGSSISFDIEPTI